MTFDPFDPQPDYRREVTPFIDGPTKQLMHLVTTTHIEASPGPFDIRITEPGESAVTVELAEETYRLALESAQRWLNNYRLSPAMRLRALRSVVGAALSDQSGA